METKKLSLIHWILEQDDIKKLLQVEDLIERMNSTEEVSQRMLGYTAKRVRVNVEDFVQLVQSIDNSNDKKVLITLEEIEQQSDNW